MKPCDYDSRPKYELLIDPLRKRARELGYAIGVHGTLKRDIDLIACPWSNEAVDAKTLAEALRLVALEVVGAAYMIPPENEDPFHLAGCPGMKPHGRLCWTFHMGGGPYIDLSVMPREVVAGAREERLRGEGANSPTGTGGKGASTWIIPPGGDGPPGQDARKANS